MRVISCRMGVNPLETPSETAPSGEVGVTRYGKMRRDHGGGLDAAVAAFGGARSDWIDLSTGINPNPYPIDSVHMADWTALPDAGAQEQLIAAARSFWGVPDDAAILAAPGASALIARMPALASPARVRITTPTYNEHAGAFSSQGWKVVENGPSEARVLVNPNNPDGRIWTALDVDTQLCVIDESFCDVDPSASLIGLAAQPGRIILKSFGKFWGLAGLRLGFAIGRPETLGPIEEALGPWPVSGPALRIGATALRDHAWAAATRDALNHDSKRLDDLMLAKGASLVGGTTLFRLYEVENANAWQDQLARHHIWTRVFPYSERYLRVGLPPANGWDRLEVAL